MTNFQEEDTVYIKDIKDPEPGLQCASCWGALQFWAYEVSFVSTEETKLFCVSCTDHFWRMPCQWCNDEPWENYKQRCHRDEYLCPEQFK